MIQFDEHIFQMGWFNQQLAVSIGMKYDLMDLHTPHCYVRFQVEKIQSSQLLSLKPFDPEVCPTRALRHARQAATPNPSTLQRQCRGQRGEEGTKRRAL